MKSKIYLIGHSHIDAVWLWDKEETKRVCQSTFKMILDLLDERDDFYYTQSTAQFYEWIEEENPEIFERIKQHVKSGKWEIVGGMWVESDCNLPSGESLVRQILYGKKYFKDKFGVDVKVGWLPDTFGYCWTLPQIFKKSGIDYFLTSKLNMQARWLLPYVLFWWESPDGSRVLSVATPGMYNNTSSSMVDRQFKMATSVQQGLHSNLIPVGKGDHGEGLTHEMINDVLENSGKSAKSFFSPALKFFEDAKEEYKNSLPVHNNELYLKTHRGTYTTRGRIKWLNRKGEVKLDVSERLCSIADLLGEEYPKNELEVVWKKLLFNQFHDALPGSSINKVYDDVEKDFEYIFNATKKITSKALKTISSNIDITGEGIALIVFNSLTWKRTDIVEVPLSSFANKDFTIIDIEGKAVPHQIVEKTSGEYVLFLAEDIPSFGYKEYRIIEKREGLRFLERGLKVSNYSLENEFFKVEISPETGVVSNIYDKVNQREVLNKNESNMLYIYEDEVQTWDDAWNINIGKLEKLHKPESITVVEEGPARVAIETTYIYEQHKRKDSIFKVKTILCQGVPRVDFDLNVDWHAKHRTVKVGFNIKGCAEFVTYEIPYGSISRRIPDSEEATAEERAKWEVPAHSWADYTPENGDYGVSLLNDCKYGFDVKNGVLRMTLLRSANVPNPLILGLEALPPAITDQGEHRIKYALYPHRGDWKMAGTPRKGQEFNVPLLYVVEKPHSGELPKEKSFLTSKGDGVLVSAVKKNENNDGIVIRLYETDGRDTIIQISVDRPLRGVWEADLMENRIRDISVNSLGEIPVSMKKFEIKTLILFPEI